MGDEADFAKTSATRQSGNFKHTSARYSARHRSCFMQLASNHQVDQTIASKPSDWFGADFVSIAQHCHAFGQGKHLLQSVRYKDDRLTVVLQFADNRPELFRFMIAE